MAFNGRGEPSSSNPLVKEPVHFFKVVLPATLEDKKLWIPKKFVEKYGVELSAVVKLTVPNGLAWHVGLTKDGENMWFSDGWHDFVKYFSICAGYFLVFRYGKDSNFHVLIFDKTACEIQYPYHCGGPEKCPNSSSKLYTPPLQLKRHKHSVGHAPEINRFRKCGISFETPNFKCPYNTGSSTRYEDEEEVKWCAPKRNRTVGTDERERAIDAANAFEPSNPFCRVVMQPSYFSMMYMPVCFSQKHLNGVSGFIKLQLSDGKQWPVCCRIRRHRATFGRGWHGFVSENNLREGDVCVFEVLRLTDIVLQVTLFHVQGSAECVNRVSPGYPVGGNKFQKCVASNENPKFRCGVDIHSKRCKIEELDVINKGDAVGDEGKLITARQKVEADSSDKENGRIKSCELELLGLLEDMGISVSRTFRRIESEDRERAIAAARLVKPTNPSFLVILQAHNLISRRLYVPLEFVKMWLSRDSKCIKVQDFNGREWPVITTWYGTSCRMKGLAGLIREKNLNEGDICIFEQITVNELFKVSVSYASGK